MTKDFRIKRKNYFRQMFGIILLCFSFVVLMTNFTLAWFRDESITSNDDVNISLIGTVSVDVTTNFNFYNLALAPDRTYVIDNLNRRIGTYLKTSESHDIEGAYVRIKYETTRVNPGESTPRDNKDLLDLYFDGNLTTNTTYTESIKNKWFYNTTDGFYYYIGAVDHNEICFNKGYKTSNIMTNVEADAKVYIKYTVDAIQRQYGAYKELEDWKNNAPKVFKEWAEADEGVRWGKQTQA